MSKKKRKPSLLVGLMLFFMGFSATPFFLYRSYINITDYIQGPSLIKPNECSNYIDRYVTIHEKVDLSKITYFREGFSKSLEYPKVYIAPLKNDPETWILISIPGDDSIEETLTIYENLQNPTGIFRDVTNISKYRSTSHSPFSKKEVINRGNLVSLASQNKIMNRQEALCVMILNSTPSFLRGIFLLIVSPLFLLFGYFGATMIVMKFKRS